jgi:hypothetical protein
MIEPDRDYELLQEACEEAVEHFNEFLDQIWDSGVFIFPRQKPQARLAYYQQNTLSADVFLVTDPDYMKLRDQGMAPPLFAEIMNEQYKVAMVEWANAKAQMDAQKLAFDEEMAAAQDTDMIMTMPPDPSMLPPEPVPPPMLWVLLLDVPRIFARAGRDFASLTNKKLRDMEAVA